MSISADVVVVGSGLSGLSAAVKLREAGKSVEVVEASATLGGRMTCLTVEGHVVDLGGQWVGATHERLKTLADELGLEKFSSFGGNTAMCWKGKRLLFEGDMSFGVCEGFAAPPQLTDEERDDIKKAWKILQEEEREDDDSISMEQFIQEKCTTAFGQFFFGAMCRSLGPLGPDEARDMSVLQFRRSQKIAAQSDIPEAYLLHGGAGQIPNLLVKKIGEEHVHLSHVVVRISHLDDGTVRVTCLRPDNSVAEVIGKAVVLAIPPPAVGRCHFEPPLPAVRMQFNTRGMQMGTCCKVLAVFESPFWKQDESIAGCLGDCPTIETGADASDPKNTKGVWAAFIVGDKYRKWAKLNEEDRMAAVKEDLVVYLGPKAKELLLDIKLADWPAHPFVLGGYGGHPVTGTLSTMTVEPVWRRIAFASTEISPEWPGYFEGALCSGHNAAAAVLKMLQ